MRWIVAVGEMHYEPSKPSAIAERLGQPAA
jgi:hypothetical protein